MIHIPIVPLHKRLADIFLHSVKVDLNPNAMKLQIYKSGFILLIIVLIAFGCKKDLKDVTPDQPSKVTSFFDMKASPDFSWKTTQSVNLELSAQVRSSVLIKSTSTGITYYKALIQPAVTYKTIISIPTFEKDLTFDVNGSPFILKIENNQIIHSF
jgi:hypothetical protein